MVVFEHFIFLNKVVVQQMIPDVPKAVQLSIKRENYLAQQALEDDLFKGQAMRERVQSVSQAVGKDNPPKVSTAGAIDSAA